MKKVLASLAVGSLMAIAVPGIASAKGGGGGPNEPAIGPVSGSQPRDRVG